VMPEMPDRDFTYRDRLLEALGDQNKAK